MSSSEGKKPKTYPGAKEKGSGFLERMKEKASRNERIHLDIKKPVRKPASGVKGRGKKMEVNKTGEELMGELECSPTMKKFIMSEFQREKQIYTFLPSSQVASAILHRYKTHLENKSSVGSSPMTSRGSPSPKASSSKPKKRQSVKIGSKRKIGASVDTDDNSDVDISDFDDEDPLPDNGSFALSPAPSQLKLQKRMLARFAMDEESYNIIESPQMSRKSPKLGRPRKTPAAEKTVFKFKTGRGRRKVKEITPMKPKLPVMGSGSLADSPELEMFPTPPQASNNNQLTGSEENVSKDNVPIPEEETNFRADNIAHSKVCGRCFAQPKEGAGPFSICSRCGTVAYCGVDCQRQEWKRHKTICKKLSTASDVHKVEIIKSLLANNNQEGVKKVVINSQPEIAKTQDFPEDPLPSNHPGPVKSILKKQVSIVMYSPPIKSLQQHLELVKEGSQEERFDNLSQESSQGNENQSSSVSCNLLSKFTSPGRNAGKLPDDKFDALIKEMEKIHSSPSETSQDGNKEDSEENDLTEYVEPMVTEEKTDGEANAQEEEETLAPLTPTNSETLVQFVQGESCSRKSSRARKETPYPRRLQEDEETEVIVRRGKLDFSFDAIEEGLEPLENEDVQRKLNFSDEDIFADNEDEDKVEGNEEKSPRDEFFNVSPNPGEKSLVRPDILSKPATVPCEGKSKVMEDTSTGPRNSIDDKSEPAVESSSKYIQSNLGENKLDEQGDSLEGSMPAAEPPNKDKDIQTFAKSPDSSIKVNPPLSSEGLVSEPSGEEVSGEDQEPSSSEVFEDASFLSAEYDPEERDSELSLMDPDSQEQV